MIKQEDSLEFLKQQKEFSADIIYCDPPYNLGSKIIVRKDGRMDYKKKIDFMNKWEVMNGDYWNNWFNEAYRSLKYGGYCIMFSIDRQCSLFKYYSVSAGFSERQSIYWYNISGFPKSADLSKNIMKYFGDKGQETGEIKKHAQKGVAIAEERGAIGGGAFGEAREEKLKTPTHPLAKKYFGYKYSICPLKSTNETILIFQKPYKTGSCLRDVLIYESGDTECGCGALNIEDCRVPTNEDLSIKRSGEKKLDTTGQGWGFKAVSRGNEGRYPAQVFCDSESAKILDKQSGIKISKRAISIRAGKHNTGIYGNFKGQKNVTIGHNGVGGCSKILHHCNFEKDEHDLYIYCPKVSRTERNNGLGNDIQDKPAGARMKSDNYTTEHMGNTPASKRLPEKNNHPAIKPISLNKQILKLFKTPNPQKILYPFAGVFSEIIGGYLVGFTEFDGCEINEEYIKIGKARFKYWTKKFEEESKQKILL